MASLNDHGICLATSVHFTIASWLPESGCKINHIELSQHTTVIGRLHYGAKSRTLPVYMCICVLFVCICILYCYFKFILYRLLILISSCYIHISPGIFDLILYFSQTVLFVCTFLNYPDLVNLVLVILNIWMPILLHWLMIAIKLLSNSPHILLWHVEFLFRSKEFLLTLYL